jgi:hypothetical protein
MNGHADIRKDDVAAVLRRAISHEPDLKTYPPVTLDTVRKRLVDSIVCTADDYSSPEDLFRKLRWGGIVVLVTSDRNDAVYANIQLTNFGFKITQQVTQIVRGPFGLSLPIFNRKIYYFVARKVDLLPPGKTTERFTYHVYLDQVADGSWVVVKEVPTIDMVTARLRAKWPKLPEDVLEKRARKFSDKIFPVFLTREAAILKIVNRDIPEDYRNRVPQLLKMERDKRGYVQRIHLSWLRNGGETLPQLEFARQSADLLRALHDNVGVMHLDMRLDNFVITPRGVGFVDFGSAVRVNENLKENPLLSNLFEELMRTSEIQRMLLNMTLSGQVTSQAISCGLHKVDKAVDYFYLAVQISSPHANPDLKDLILFDKQSPEARELARLTEQILRPADPAIPTFRSAADILAGIEGIQSLAPSADRSGKNPSKPVNDSSAEKIVPST